MTTEQEAKITAILRHEKLFIFNRKENIAVKAPGYEERKEELAKASEEEINKQFTKITIELEEEQEFNKLKIQISNSLLLKNKAEASEQIVEHIKKTQTIKTTRDDNNPELWIYEEGIYKPEGRTYIQELCRKLLGDAYTTHFANLVIGKIEADTFIQQQLFFNEQNKHPYLIPCLNGILNIKTRELQPFTKDIPFFNKIPTTYNPEAQPELIKKFITEITSKQEDIDTLQEMTGFCLLKEYKYEKAFMLHGDGRNGKSKYLELLKKMLGADNISNTPISQMEGEDGFAIHNLHNKLVNIAAEVTAKSLKGGGTFKSLVGRDEITANRKFKNYINFQNYATLIFATNNLPQPTDMSDAFFLRWVVIKFPNQFLPQKEIDAIPEAKRTNIKLQDPELLERISTPRELSGFLNWAIEGLQRLEEQKDFTYKKTMHKLKTSWLRSSNSLIAFYEDMLIEDWGEYITKDSLKRVYMDYCKKHKINMLDDRRILYTLTKDYGVASEKKYVVDGVGNNVQVRIWRNVRFKLKADLEVQSAL